MQPISPKRYLALAALIALCIIVLFFFGISLLKTVTPNTTYRANNPTQTSFGATDRGGMSAMPSEGIASDIAMPEPKMINPIRPPDSSTPLLNVDPSERKIIKSGNISIVVKNVDQAAKELEQKAIELQGYLASNNFYNNGNTKNKTGYIRIRVPVEKVTAFVEYTKSRAVKVQTENINSEDVTSQYVDVQAKIKNLETLADTYRKLLGTTTKVSEVLEIQRELNNVQTQIDQYKGQAQYLENNAAMADITVNLATDEGELPIQPANKWEPANVFKASLRALTSFFQNLSYIGIAVAVFSIVWIPILVGLYFLYKFLRKKIK